MQDGLLQGPLAQIVVERGPRLTQEQRQLIPVSQHVNNGAAEGRVGLGQLLIELSSQPSVQLLHRRLARFLMKTQPRFGPLRLIRLAPYRDHRV